MSDPPTSPRRSWRPRFGLRTMFLLVTVFCVWLGYQLNWIRQRHAALGEGALVVRNTCRPPARAPGGLWLFGERGVKSIAVESGSDSEVDRACALFPEAQVVNR